MAADPGKVRSFITVVMSAISNCSLYSKDHASVGEFSQKAFMLLTELLADTGSLEVMAVGKDLIVNKNPLRDEGVHGKNLMRRFKRKEISRVDFSAGVTVQEIKQFVADMAEIEKSASTYAHIRTGSVGVRDYQATIVAPAGMSIPADVSTEQLARVKEFYQHVSPFQQLSTEGLEEIVMNFIVSFKREANILHLISPVKAYSEYTYTHATNVAVLSLFQAESLGIKDQLLYDIGIAALLHDVGKLFVPREILEKKAKLDDWEWEEIQRHTVYGAKYLARINGLTHLSPIAAFEHHMRYDGQGYPRMSTNGRKQHLCSQIIAIADFFDALRSRRPYKKDWEITEILSLLKKSAGKEFNPVLVDNFSRIMSLALKLK